MARDMFLKLEGINGESEDHAHKKWIDVHSWSWGMSQTGSAHEGKGSGSGKVSVQDVHFTKKFDTATTALMLHCANGKYIKTGTLIMRKAMGDKQLDYLKIEFEDILISSYQTGGSGDDIPIDSISFNFAQHNVTYTPQDNDKAGSAVVHGWNMRNNKAV